MNKELLVGMPAESVTVERENGLIMANVDVKRSHYLCSIVYQPRDSHQEYVRGADYNDGHIRRFYCHGEKTDTQIICQESIKHGMEIIVRGTGSAWSLVTDMKCWQTAMPNVDSRDFGCVHTGFLNAALDVLIPIRSWMKASKKHAESTVCITGHSLGGAIATILGALLHDTHKEMVVVTFGSPRVGNLEFMGSIMSTPRLTLIRVVNDNDPVAMVPFVGYHHVGTAIVMCGVPDETTSAELQRTWWGYAAHIQQMIGRIVPSTSGHTLHEYQTRLMRMAA
jgi:hypothetical protein